MRSAIFQFLIVCVFDATTTFCLFGRPTTQHRMVPKPFTDTSISSRRLIENLRFALIGNDLIITKCRRDEDRVLRPELLAVLRGKIQKNGREASPA